MLSLADRASIERALSPSNPFALPSLLAGRLSRLITFEGCDLIDLTHFIVVQPGDDEAGIAREVGFSPLVNAIDGSRYPSPAFEPSWEALQDLGGWFEMIVTVGDSGFAYILFIQDSAGVEPELLTLCRAYAD